MTRTTRSAPPKPRPASPTQVDPDRLDRIWSLSPAERHAAALRGDFADLTPGELARWSIARPNEVPLINGEFFYIVAGLADFEDA